MSDFILLRLRNDIETFYDEFFQGDAVAKRQLHLTLLEHYYDPTYFASAEDLSVARNTFLERLSDLVEETYCE